MMRIPMDGQEILLSFFATAPNLFGFRIGSEAIMSPRRTRILSRKGL